MSFARASPFVCIFCVSMSDITFKYRFPASDCMTNPTLVDMEEAMVQDFALKCGRKLKAMKKMTKARRMKKSEDMEKQYDIHLANAQKSIAALRQCAVERKVFAAYDNFMSEQEAIKKNSKNAIEEQRAALFELEMNINTTSANAQALPSSTSVRSLPAPSVVPAQSDPAPMDEPVQIFIQHANKSMGTTTHSVRLDDTSVVDECLQYLDSLYFANNYYTQPVLKSGASFKQSGIGPNQTISVFMRGFGGRPQATFGDADVQYDFVPPRSDVDVPRSDVHSQGVFVFRIFFPCSFIVHQNVVCCRL